MQTTSTSTIQQSRAIISRPWVHYIVYVYTVSQKKPGTQYCAIELNECVS